MTRKLRPGTHTVNIKGKMRQVLVKANGQWKFLKGSGASKPNKSKGSNRGATKRGGSTANKGKGKKGKQGKQGLVSWLVNVASLGIVAANPIIRAGQASRQPEGTKLNWFLRVMLKDYMGVTVDESLSYQSFAAKDMIRGWGTVGAGVAFKKGMTYATKNITVRSMLPGM